MAKLSKEGTSTHDGYIYGVAAVEFMGKDIGSIAEEGLSFGGQKASTVAIRSAQRPDYPVKILKGTPASKVISGKLIELRPEALKHIFGGEISGNKWTAPNEDVIKEGPFAIRTLDGATISEGKCSFLAQLAGNLKHNEVLHVDFEMTIISDGSKAPMSIDFGK